VKGNVVKCPKCVEEGVKSRVRLDSYSTSTLMCDHSFYDEDGKYHYHDPNKRSQGARCSNGHSFYITTTPGCGACGKKDEVEVQYV
jgi:hypothetical protein